MSWATKWGFLKDQGEAGSDFESAWEKFGGQILKLSFDNILLWKGKFELTKLYGRIIIQDNKIFESLQCK